MTDKLVAKEQGALSEVKPLTEQDVRLLLGKQAEGVDALTLKKFLTLCNTKGLNPFVNEAYLIPFKEGGESGTTRYNIVVSKDVFLKRAATAPDCDGFTSGVVVVKKSGELVEREGSLVLPDERLVGGWALVKRKSFSIPIKKTVSISEYAKPTRAWKQMPATMIAKVALVQALRDAFPTEFAGMYTEEELRETDAQVVSPISERVVEAEVKKAEVVEEKKPEVKEVKKEEQKQEAKQPEMDKEHKEVFEFVADLVKKNILTKENVVELLGKYGVKRVAELSLDQLPVFVDDVIEFTKKGN